MEKEFTPFNQEKPSQEASLVSAQLGRPSRFRFNVVYRCPFDWPAVIESAPYSAQGLPHPTLYYLTCPHLEREVSRLEAGGGVRRFSALLQRRVTWQKNLAEITRRYRARRKALAGSARRNDGGVCLESGIAGVTDPAKLKCLHAHTAVALLRPDYLLGKALLRSLPDRWCSKGEGCTDGSFEGE